MAKSRAPARPAKAARPPKAGVCIVGSLNMDLVCRTESIPQPGQTVVGQDLLEVPGGKGANQAAAVGRLWAKHPRAGVSPACRIIGRVGNDSFGKRIIETLAATHVDTSSILATRDVPSGIAMITVDRHGENAIVVATGANSRLAVTDLLVRRAAIEHSVVLAAQLEIPFETVACAIALAKQAGVLTVLDPSPVPAEGLPESLFHVDILCPNQSEAHLLTGIIVRTMDDARRAGERLLARGAQTVVVKMGAGGAVIVSRLADGQTSAQHINGFKVKAVDTTGAGDCFIGALAVALAEGRTLPEAVRFANAAGAVACTKLGAQTAIPTRAEVDAFLAPKAQ
jgi:ribokinase